MSLLLRASIVATIALLVAAFASNVIRQAKDAELPHGCDQFGYLRQARLFQELGWRSGLNTELKNPQTDYLIEHAFALGGTPALFAHGVAPHCHHYDERTGRVILQYPPGVGWLLSFFSEGAQLRWVFALSGLILLAVLVATTASARTVLVPLLVVLLGLLLFRGHYHFRWAYSIAPSLAFALLLGWLTVAASTSSGRRRIVGFALLGLGFGLATNLRLPNLFSAVGPGIVLAALFLARPGRTAALAAAAFGICTVIGLSPTLVANAINAGHPLNTTYGAADASPPVLTLQAFGEGISFYLYNPGTPALFVWMGLAGLAALAVLARRAQAKDVRNACLMATLAIAVNLLYFVPHRPLIDYYMTFAAFYALAIATFGLLKLAGAVEDAALSRTGRVALQAAAALVAILIIVGVDQPRADPEKRRVTAAIEPTAIVWCDVTSGAFSYTARRQAAVLPFIIIAPLRERLVRKIAADGIPQYLVVDSEPMTRLAAELRAYARLDAAGAAFGNPVYRVVVQGSQEASGSPPSGAR